MKKHMNTDMIWMDGWCMAICNATIRLRRLGMKLGPVRCN